MKTCPRCGFHHSDADRRCVRCKTVLDAMGEPDPLAPPEREVFDFRPGQAARWRWEAPRRWAGSFLRRAWVWRERLRSPLPENIYTRNPWVSGALSLFPGLGQLYNHQPKKAFFFFFGLAAWLALFVLTFFDPLSTLVAWLYAAAAALAFHDGFTTAKRINREYLPWQHLVAFYCAWIFYITASFVLLQYLGTQKFFYQMHVAKNDGLAPMIYPGERFVVDPVSYFFRRPRVGELVVYDPPAIRLSVHIGMVNEATVQPRAVFNRISAGPGDTLERTPAGIFRNGRPITPAEAPLFSFLPAEFKLTAPPGCYILLLDEVREFHSELIDFARYHVINWPQICIVPRRAIKGRVWLVYHPPPARRFVR